MHCKYLYLSTKGERIRTVTLSSRKKYIHKNIINNLLSFTIRIQRSVFYCHLAW